MQRLKMERRIHGNLRLMKHRLVLELCLLRVTHKMKLIHIQVYFVFVYFDYIDIYIYIYINVMYHLI